MSLYTVDYEDGLYLKATNLRNIALGARGQAGKKQNKRSLTVFQLGSQWECRSTLTRMARQGIVLRRNMRGDVNRNMPGSYQHMETCLAYLRSSGGENKNKNKNKPVRYCLGHRPKLN